MYVTHGPETSQHLVVFAPGDAGRLEDSHFTQLAHGLGEAGFQVVRFAAPSSDSNESNTLDARMAERIRQATELHRKEQTLVLAGLSRGARVSAMLLEELGASGLVGFAYPFHDRGDPNPRGREKALAHVHQPVLICQGTRDSHGNLQQIRGYHLPAHIQLHWLEDANHALHPRPSSRYTQQALLKEALATVAAFIHTLS